MAKQSGHIFITGTIHDVTYYKMYDTYYARMKSSLSRKKVLESPRFARTRMHAGQLADASRIASQLYRSIPKEKRNRPMFRAFVGKAKVLLAEGNSKEVVLEMLLNELHPQPKVSVTKQIKKKKTERAYVSKAGRLIWKASTNSLITRFSHRQLRLDYFKKERNYSLANKARDHLTKYKCHTV